MYQSCQAHNLWACFYLPLTSSTLVLLGISLSAGCSSTDVVISALRLAMTRGDGSWEGADSPVAMWAIYVSDNWWHHYLKRCVLRMSHCLSTQLCSECVHASQKGKTHDHQAHPKNTITSNLGKRYPWNKKRMVWHPFKDTLMGDKVCKKKSPSGL